MNKSVVILALMRAKADGVLDTIHREYTLAQAYADPEQHDELVQDIGDYVANERADGKCAKCESNNNCILQKIAADTLDVKTVISPYGFVRKIAKMDDWVNRQLDAGRTQEEIMQDAELNLMLTEARITSDILR